MRTVLSTRCLHQLSIPALTMVALSSMVGHLAADTSSPSTEAVTSHTYATQSVTLIAWPSPNYLAVRKLIDDGHAAQAVAMLRRDMAGLFPYGQVVTNGYPLGFFYASLLGDALAANRQPVEAIDFYRQALWAVPATVVTAQPVVYARTLHRLGLQFRMLRRYTDAIGLFASAGALVNAVPVESDLHFTRCVQAARMYDWRTAADEAEACMALDPDYNTEAFHYAAAEKFSRGCHGEAIDLWLTGLYGLPPEQVEAYLDIALQYWKNITDDQIAAYYNALEYLLNRAGPNARQACARILSERIKLQKLYPHRFPTDNPADLMAGQGSVFASFADDADDAWLPRTNAVLAIDFRLLSTNTWEHQLNDALLLIVHREDDYRNGTRARAIIDHLLSNEHVLAQQDICIDDWRLPFMARFLRAIVESMASNHDDDTRARQNENIALCDRMLKENRAGQGMLDLVFKLNLQKWQHAQLQHDREAMEQITAYLRSLYRDAQILLQLELMNRNTSQDTTAAAMREILGDLCGMPNTFPESRYWEQWAEVTLLAAELSTNSSGAAEAQTAAIDILFDGLEKSVAYSAPQDSLFGSSARPWRNACPLLSALQKYRSQGMFNKRHYERLRRFLERYGVCIPATTAHTHLLKDIMLWRRELQAIERTHDVELTVLCDARPWGDAAKVVLWSNTTATPVEMAKTDETGIWTATLIVPRDIYVAAFEFYRAVADIPAEPERGPHRRVVVPDDESRQMTVRGTVRRDTPAIMVFQCDAHAAELATNVFLVGSIDEVGRWRLDRALVMSDDGVTQGDAQAGDGIFTCTFSVPSHTRSFSYLYTDGDNKGEWGYGTPECRRNCAVPDGYWATNTVTDTFGRGMR
jgi:hypothetical protein